MYVDVLGTLSFDVSVFRVPSGAWMGMRMRMRMHGNAAMGVGDGDGDGDAGNEG